MQIKAARKDNPTQAMQVAHEIKDTPRGVALALRDFNVFGGETRGISSWILENSGRSEDVNSNLRRVAADQEQPLSRRFEALWILWRRGDQGEFSLIDQMFQLVVPAGQPSVGVARRKLAQCFDPSFAELQQALNLPAATPLKVSLEEFQLLSRRLGAIVKH